MPNRKLKIGTRVRVNLNYSPATALAVRTGTVVANYDGSTDVHIRLDDMPVGEMGLFARDELDVIQDIKIAGGFYDKLS